MATELQIAANRMNAKSSTGPRTAEGKAQSRMNAVTHGLTARAGLLAHEDPEEFAHLSEAVIAEFRPGNTLEHELIERIVSILWRLRRVACFEAALLEWVEACLRRQSRLEVRYPALSCDPGASSDALNEEELPQLALGRTIDFF